MQWLSSHFIFVTCKMGSRLDSVFGKIKISQCMLGIRIWMAHHEKRAGCLLSADALVANVQPMGDLMLKEEKWQNWKCPCLFQQDKLECGWKKWNPLWWKKNSTVMTSDTCCKCPDSHDWFLFSHFWLKTLLVLITSQWQHHPIGTSAQKMSDFLQIYQNDRFWKTWNSLPGSIKCSAINHAIGSFSCHPWIFQNQSFGQTEHSPPKPNSLWHSTSCLHVVFILCFKLVGLCHAISAVKCWFQLFWFCHFCILFGCQFSWTLLPECPVPNNWVQSKDFVQKLKIHHNHVTVQQCDKLSHFQKCSHFQKWHECGMLLKERRLCYKWMKSSVHCLDQKDKQAKMPKIKQPSKLTSAFITLSMQPKCQDFLTTHCGSQFAFCASWVCQPLVTPAGPCQVWLACSFIVEQKRQSGQSWDWKIPNWIFEFMPWAVPLQKRFCHCKQQSKAMQTKIQCIN